MNAAGALDGGFPAIAGLDRSQALRRLGGDEALLLRLLRMLRRDHADDAARVRDDCATGELHTAARRMHTLRGAAGNLAAPRVAQAAQELEGALRAGEVQGLEARLGALEAALRELLAGVPEEAVAAQDAASAGTSGGAAPDPCDLARLIEALDSYNVAALDRFEALRPALAARHGAQALQRLAETVEALRFAEAAAVLRGWYPAG